MNTQIESITNPVPETLKRQLLQFGLNPGEWDLEPIQPELWSIRHNDDPEFRFVGKSHDTDLGARWTQISLASL